MVRAVATYTIADLNDLYSVILSNENQTIPTDSTGKVTQAITVSTDIDIFQGTDRIAGTIGSVTLRNASGATISFGTITKSNPTASASGKVTWSIPTNTNISSDMGYINIPIIVDEVSYTKKLYWNKSKDGAKGDDGVGISSITEYYNISSTTTAPTSGWDTTIPTMTSTNRYLWNYEKITYTNGSHTETTKKIIGVYGNTGSAGKGISSIVNYYLATSASSGVTTGTSGWTTGIQTVTSSKKYLWNYEVINYTSGSPTTTAPIIIGVYGDKGEDGKGITSTTITYQIHTNGTTAPTGTWSSTVPSPIKGRYLWTRIVTEYTDNSEVTTYSVSYYATDGQKGDKGDKGDQGPQGIQGPKGDDGQSQWVHIRYSANSNGSGMTTNPSSTTKYVGIAVTNSSTAPSYTGFTWSKYVGEDGIQGPQGIQGPKGDNGQPTYTWIKYADTPTSGMNNFPDGKKYIGMAFNKTTATESNNYSDYQWSLMPQNIEIGGRNLLRNSEAEKTSSREYVMYANIAPIFDEHGVGEYTFSFDLKVGVAGYVRVYCTDRSDDYIKYIFPSRAFTATTEYKRYSMTVNVTENNSSATHTSLAFYGTYDTGRIPTIKNVKIEKGNTATDWTPAPEDVDEAIQNAQDTADQANNKADGLQGDLIEYMETTATAEELGDLIASMNEYTALLDTANAEVENAKLEIADLLERVPAVELQLGEFIQSWIFLDTYVRMGEEGLLIQEINGQTGIRITTDRIDFLDGSGEPVAYITNQIMRINRGIFVKSAQIGEHKIETIGNGHTIFTWMG